MKQRDYSVRAWLDPDKMAALGIDVSDVLTAIGEQNLQVAAGQIGQPPAPKGQQFQLAVNTLGRLTTPQQFGDIIIKAAQGNPMVQSSPTGLATTATATGSSGQSGQSGQSGPTPPTTGIVRLRDVVTRACDGRGAEMRPSLGLAVFSGMLGVTFFGIFLTPVFFYVIGWLGERRAPATGRDEGHG